MESSEKIFKYSFSFVKIMNVISALFFISIGGIVLFSDEIELWQRLTYGGISLVFLAVMTVAGANVTLSVKLSSDKIVVRGLFREKSLAWNELTRVTATGASLVLYNRDNTVKLIISSQLKDYREILEIIFKKCPALFKKDEDIILRGKGHDWIVFASVLFFTAVAIFVPGIVLKIFVGLMAVFTIVYWFSSPLSVTLNEESLLVTYLFREVNYPARWIDSITIENRGGDGSYFVRLALRTGKSVDFSTFPHGGILDYPSIQRWYKKAMTKQSSVSF